MEIYNTSFDAATALKYIEEFKTSSPSKDVIQSIDAILEQTFKCGHTTAHISLIVEKPNKTWEPIERYYTQLGYIAHTDIPVSDAFVFAVTMHIFPAGTQEEFLANDNTITMFDTRKSWSDIVVEKIVNDADDSADGPEEIEGITMWIARNKDGRLKLYAEKPVRAPEKAIYESQNFWHISDMSTNTEIAKMGTFINNNMCPYLTWEDEPIKVELTIASNKDE